MDRTIVLIAFAAGVAGALALYFLRGWLHRQGRWMPANDNSLRPRPSGHEPAKVTAAEDIAEGLYDHRVGADDAALREFAEIVRRSGGDVAWRKTDGTIAPDDPHSNA